MRARVLVPIMLALAAIAGLVFGGFLPKTDAASVAANAGTEIDGKPGDSAADGSPAPSPTPQLTIGTTSPPNEQPNLDIQKLTPGQQPPQFIVVSFDGSCETKDKLFTHYLETAEKVDGRFTFNISGLCILPDDSRRLQYQPPNKPAGTSDIGFGDPALIPDRINTWTRAWESGHEMATHYLGHFCGKSGVQSWDSAGWTSEINQFNDIITNWPKNNSEISGVNALPFDVSTIKGGRTPCLEGQPAQMYPAMVAAGYTYDSSATGMLAWPKKFDNYNLWNFPLQTIKVAGTNQRNLSMDYNFLVTQNAGKTQAEPARCQQIEESTYQSLMAAGEAVYSGNRAPFFIGNHFNNWVCGAYKNSLTKFIIDFKARHPDALFISNLDLQRWLEAQDPAVVAQLQALPAQTQ